MATQIAEYAPDWGILNGKGLQQLITNIKTADNEIKTAYEEADNEIKTAYEEADAKKVNLGETANITGPWSGSFLFQDDKESPTIKLYFNSNGLSLNSISESKAETSVISYDKTKNSIMITGATTLDSTLNVTGATTLSSTLYANSNVILKDSLLVYKDTNLYGGLTVHTTAGEYVTAKLTVSSDAVRITTALVLTDTSGCYGTEEPANLISSPKIGQVYFKII